MNDFSIRITRHEGDVQQSIDIDYRQTLPLQLLSANEATIGDDAMVAGNADDMAAALTQIAAELKCDNNLDDMLYAIDRLAPPRLEWSATLCDLKQADRASAEKAIAALEGVGWRFPKRAEQESNLDITRHSPACDPKRFPDMQSGPYWCEEEYAPNRGYFWVVDFGLGASFGRPRNNAAFVRAVRSLPPGQ